MSVAGSTAFAKIDGTPRYVFLAPRSLNSPGKIQEGPMILDLSGDLVWFRPSTVPAVFNLTPQTYRGERVMTWWSGRTGPTYGEGGYTVLDGSYRQVASVEGANGLRGDLHEFLITPENTALFTAYDMTNYEGKLVFQGVAFEVDVASGDVVYEWGSLGATRVALAESYTPQPSKSSEAWDYFHINSIDLWPGSERDLLISARNTCAIYRVDRRTGDIVWRLGGKRSDFAMTDETRFWWQHDARPLRDGSGLTLFDDASDPVERGHGDPESRGLMLAFGPGAGEVKLAHECLHTDTATAGNEAGFMGNTQLLPGGGYFVGWGGNIPYFSGFSPPGESLEASIVLDGRFPDGWFSYRSYLADWIGRPPLSELSLVVRPAQATSDKWDAYVSWNGATEVAHWRLSAGPSEAALSPAAVVARTGFETTATVSASGASSATSPEFRAEALDARGRILGRSVSVSATST